MTLPFSRRQFLKPAATTVGGLTVMGGRQNLPNTPPSPAAGQPDTPVTFVAGPYDD